MFLHRQALQYSASTEKPDAVYARKLQEVIGGQYGEITVAMQYSFQAWNAHIPGKYRDLLFSTAAEEFGHVEMLATMVAQLLEKAPHGITDDAVQDDPTVAAVVGGMDVQDAILAGAGARPVDSNGNPWNAGYVTASGNLLADFTSNINAEMQGRIAVARLYHQTDDPGVRDLLSFLLARDTHHQNQWLAAARELQESGVEQLPVPSNFPIKKEHREFSYQAINFSDGESMAEGPWASGPSPDGLGEFTYVDTPMEGVPMPPPTHPDSRFYGTTEAPNFVEKAAGAVQDALKRS
ncbi:manganese catalase family protein [Nesterenkonia jeotgali]|uniref:Manganese catalase n=1 Tax=Nesterenkonia jeotgali TaxID=317018 RepID=A0A0W8IJY2_9MICC|nr:manganese catalase family protein [Nesterenkonia jeotgali]KUG60301.1 manganese catalase [Nesterenkonia jeotgali]